MSSAQARDVKAILNYCAIHGMNNMPPSLYAKAAKLIAKYRMNMEDATDLFTKYIGTWGGKSTEFRFEAIKNGKVVKTVTKGTMSKYHLDLEPSSTTLTDDKSYDVALIRITLRDQYNNILPYSAIPVVLETTGDIELIGPDIITLQGGMFGTYVRTVRPSAIITPEESSESPKKSKGKLTAKLKSIDNKHESATVEFNIYLR